MSGNQKQTAGGGPQNPRYSSNAIYQPIPQRTDGFHVPTPSYVQQQPNQPGNQPQGLRGIPQTGPPNQSSTPPTNDLKVQSVPQQSMNHMFVNPQQQVRGNQSHFYRPSAGPPSQTPRMPTQHRGQQQLYPAQATPFVQMPVPHQMYVATPNPMQYYNGQRQPTYLPPTVVYGGQNIPSQFTFSPSPNQTVPYQIFSPLPHPRPGHPPQTTTVPTNPAPPLQNLPLAPTATQQPQFSRPQHKRRAKAIPVIDPDTGVDRLDELYEQQNNSHPPSGESSARQTPQPAMNNPNKEVQAAFAKQVAQAISNDEPSIEDQEIHPVQGDHIETMYHHPAPQPNIPTSTRLDHIVQTSNLKAQAKEFVSNSLHTAKETPIVSAICDAVEVTLPNKQAKDRESPTKGRKQREQQQPREHKDSGNKDIVSGAGVAANSSAKENIISDNKESSNVKIDNNNKTKESTLSSAAPTLVVAPSSANINPVVPSPITNKDNNKEVVTHRDDKKNQKKDSKSDVKVPNDNECVPSSAQDASANAKSKNASQRTKEAQKQQQQQQQQLPVANQKQTPVSVPPPQPAKANSKTSKKSELNQKGANKEGTDMDAFNDNVRLDNVNANDSNVNNEINANSVINNTTNNAQPTNVNEANKKNHNNANIEVPTIKADTTKLPLPKKIDITDIVKDKPKPINLPAQTQSQDETDRAALSNDKLVQAKNEANAKVSTDSSAPALIEKSDLIYREGQWAPHNLDGKKVYDKEFLLNLRNKPASKRKPENLPDSVLADDRGRPSEGRFSMGGGRTDFTNPPFPNYGGKSSSQRGPPPKRNSQSGKSGGGGGKGSKSQLIKVSISVREDVKLHEVENAWKPARFKKGEEMSDDEHKTEELYKKVRGVLNKLTPQKFETLVSQVRDLQIDTAERLQGVIDLVFEKAVDEPNFSVAYALMCRELALMQVPAANSTDDKKEVVNFRKLLVTRCQIEFEKQSQDESVRKEKVKEINDCADPEKKKELQFDLEEYDRRLRMKSVGNIRFIGELFKQQMLTVNIMLRCLNNLLENKDKESNHDEESLECLCKLLTTIGKELESKKIDLGSIFNIMKEIADKKRGKVSSRVRFMLQDVIDLRRSKWIPRRGDLNPKTIDQIQKEADNEQLNIQAMNSVPITPRKDDRGSSAGPSSDRKARRNVSDDGWQTASRNRAAAFTVQSDKLKNKPPLTDEPLGNRQMFGNWSKGSVIKTDCSAAANTANMYAALEMIDTEKRPAGRPNSKDPYSSKGPSLERGTYKQYDGRGSSRSGSQHRSNERESSVPSSQKSAASTSQTMSTVPKPAQVPVPSYILNEDQLKRHVENNLDEYLNDSITVEEYSQDTLSTVSPSYFPRLVAEGYLHVLERSKTARLRTGFLFAKLIHLGTLPIEAYCTGLEEILNQVEDLTIDIPMFWDYLGEILLHVICEEALSFNRLHKSCEYLINQNYGSKFLASLFKLVVSEKGPNFLMKIWQASGLTLDSFVDPSQVESFVKDNKLDFLCGGDTAAGQSQLTYEQIHKKLLDFLSSKTLFDDIVNWITANVGERNNENKFIRTLATAIFEYSISRQKFVIENLQENYKLLQKYVDNKLSFELQCLFALQSLIHRLEHPKGVLLSICDRLYEDAIISQDSFIAWEVSEDPAEQEGKGVALKQLTSFFTQLKENEEEDYGSSSDEA